VRASAGAQLDGELPGAPPSGVRPSAASALGPLVAIGVTPGRAWSLTASAASRARFPTLRERFSTAFGAFVANPELRPERAWNFSLDAAYKPSRELRVAVGLFDSELTDLVTTVVVAPQTQQLQNASGARFVGAEALLTCAPTGWLDLLAGWMTMQVRTDNGQPLPYKPENKGLVGLTVTPWPSLSIGAVARYVGAEDFQNPDTSVWGRLGGYALIDARVDWRLHPGLKAWVRATNVADTNVEARYSFPEAGRQIFLGLAARLGS
jgi:iron complex outermembrane receptor protein